DALPENAKTIEDLLEKARTSDAQVRVDHHTRTRRAGRLEGLRGRLRLRGRGRDHRRNRDRDDSAAAK
ncbi:hypothetical protein AB0G21_31460, partial [Streptomyces sp. NPDC023588]